MSETWSGVRSSRKTSESGHPSTPATGLLDPWLFSAKQQGQKDEDTAVVSELGSGVVCAGALYTNIW